MTNPKRGWRWPTSCRWLVGVLAAVLVVALASLVAAKPASQPEKKAVPLAVLLQHFDKLSPQARLKLLSKVAKEDAEFQPAVRGDVTMSIVARGSLESADNDDIYCQVKATVKGSTVATTIRDIVDEGMEVKKGQIVMVLEDSDFQKQLKVKTREYQQAAANKKAAQATLDLQKLQHEVDVLAAEIAIRAAELEMKKYAGNDPAEKEILKLKLDLAKLSEPLIKASAKSKQLQAEEDLRLKTANAEADLALIQDIKLQIERCVIKAPRAGLVLYYHPEQIRGGSGAPKQIVAQGEPVREGQKLLQIPNLDKMLVNVRVSEALVRHIRRERDEKNNQSALIKVDAFPKTVLKGHVKFVDTIASPPDFFAPDVKVYKTLVAIDNDKNPKMPSLLPRMSAEVTIEVEPKKGVVAVPIQAVVHSDKTDYCYVKVGKEIQKREVVTGLRNKVFAEIISGVEENDMVVRDVEGLLEQVRPLLNLPAT